MTGGHFTHPIAGSISDHQMFDAFGSAEVWNPIRGDQCIFGWERQRGTHGCDLLGPGWTVRKPQAFLKLTEMVIKQRHRQDKGWPWSCQKCSCNPCRMSPLFRIPSAFWRTAAVEAIFFFRWLKLYWNLMWKWVNAYCMLPSSKLI